ncbi:hypothetical protein [Actinoplanes sp. NPDC049316]|uniref:hypothetical protein n=1 Tax=Actinoplanes sp. NPDC049316 TaxID=3154727 RepID=UPI00341E7059
MDLQDYQRRTEQVRAQAGETSPVPVQGCQLTAAAGTVATAVLHGQHGLLTDGGYRDALRAGLADLLHRTASLATTAGLDLSEIATTSLATLDDLDAACTQVAYTVLPAFDADYPEAEQLPRRLTIRFDEEIGPSGRRIVTATLTSTQPATAGGSAARTGAQPLQPGDRLGDPLTDNAHRPDGYRFHDAIHFGFLAVLGWSPNLRALLRRKRKSDPMVDECEDGARAIFTEEGLAAILARLAETRIGFRRYHAVTSDIVDLARAATAGLEVARAPGWLWRQAIWQGFRAMDQLVMHGGGLLIADLDARELTFQAVDAVHEPHPDIQSSPIAA